MNQIAVRIKPFDFKQKISILKNGEEFFEEIEFSNIEEGLKGLCQKYDIETVDLFGSKSYTEHIKDKLVGTHFNNNKIINVFIH